jgi:DNA-binding NarL/FixJ family response regulator
MVRRPCRKSKEIPQISVRLPGVNGLQLTQRVKKDFPDINVAILTDDDLPEYRQAAVQYGADCFYVKNSFKWDELEALVRSISLGGP